MSQENNQENKPQDEVQAEQAASTASSAETPTEAEAAGASAETAETEKDPIVALQEQVEALTKENAELKDQVLRRAADFDNFRKRSFQEKQDAIDYANTSILKDLLDSLDNFDRTVEAAATATDPKAIADGVKMISTSMVSMLENKYNLVAYGQAGEAFDPEIHEAIASSNDPVAEPCLKAVYLKGYKLKDRVIRHAKVMVSMPDGSVKADEAPQAAAENAQ